MKMMLEMSEDGVTVFVLFTNRLVAFGRVCLSSRDDYVRDARKTLWCRQRRGT